MHYRTGFSLIECTVYVSGLFLLVMIMMRFITTNHTRLQTHMANTDMLMSLYATIDVIGHDLIIAPMQKNKWKKYEKNEYIWHNGQQDIGWQVKKGTLRRIKGLYKETNHQWQVKKSCIVAQGITELSMEHQPDKQNIIINLKATQGNNECAVRQAVVPII